MGHSFLPAWISLWNEFLVAWTRISEWNSTQCSYLFICPSTDTSHLILYNVETHPRSCLGILHQSSLLEDAHMDVGVLWVEWGSGVLSVMYDGVTNWSLYEGFWWHYLAVIFSFLTFFTSCSSWVWGWFSFQNLLLASASLQNITK